MGTALEFVSLFSGAGGLDLGFEIAGWKCLYASDIDPDAVATLSANRFAGFGEDKKALRDAVIRCEDVRSLSGSRILKAIGRKKGQVPLLVGGPPCQSWSSAGHQLGFEDARGKLFADFVRIAKELDVRWIAFENVRGLLTAKGPDGVPGSALRLIRADLLKAGFQTTVELLNAADYGVPQRRVRLFIIGYRPGDVQPSFPSPTHQKFPLDNGKSAKWISLEDCLNGIETVHDDEIIRPASNLAAQLKVLVPGTGVRSPGKKEATRPGGHWGYKQGAFLADSKLPARTVTASSQQDWVQDSNIGIRRLSPRECAALQSFPHTWKFIGNRSTQYRLIGNAVPQLLASAVAKALAKHLDAFQMSNLVDADKKTELIPLGPALRAAIQYTVKEQLRNGPSRLAAPLRRRSRIIASVS